MRIHFILSLIYGAKIHTLTFDWTTLSNSNSHSYNWATNEPTKRIQFKCVNGNQMFYHFSVRQFLSKDLFWGILKSNFTIDIISSQSKTTSLKVSIKIITKNLRSNVSCTKWFRRIYWWNILQKKLIKLNNMSSFFSFTKLNQTFLIFLQITTFYFQLFISHFGTAKTHLELKSGKSFTVKMA